MLLIAFAHEIIVGGYKAHRCNICHIMKLPINEKQQVKGQSCSDLELEVQKIAECKSEARLELERAYVAG
jgi:hypothetical protein